MPESWCVVFSCGILRYLWGPSFSHWLSVLPQASCFSFGKPPRGGWSGRMRTGRNTAYSLHTNQNNYYEVENESLYSLHQTYVRRKHFKWSWQFKTSFIPQCERYGGGKGIFAIVLHEQAGTSHTLVSDQTPGLLSEGKNRQAKLW